MVEHLTQKQVEDYRRQQLRVADLLSVSEHLGECESCRRLIECAMNGDAAFFALRSEVFGEAAEIASPLLARAHLSAEQTAGYVDRKLSGEELQMVGDHLSNCEQCAVAVDDLQTFRNQIARSLEREYHPADHLTLGLLHAQAELPKEAEQELRALQKANPDSEISRSLLSQVQALRRSSE